MTEKSGLNPMASERIFKELNNFTNKKNRRQSYWDFCCRCEQ